MTKLKFLFPLALLTACSHEAPAPQQATLDSCQSTANQLTENLKNAPANEAGVTALRQFVFETKAGGRYWAHFTKNVCAFNQAEQGGNSCAKFADERQLDCLVKLSKNIGKTSGLTLQDICFLQALAKDALRGPVAKDDVPEKNKTRSAFARSTASMRFYAYVQSALRDRKHARDFLGPHPSEKEANAANAVDAAEEQSAQAMQTKAQSLARKQLRGLWDLPGLTENQQQQLESYSRRLTEREYDRP